MDVILYSKFAPGSTHPYPAVSTTARYRGIYYKRMKESYVIKPIAEHVQKPLVFQRSLMGFDYRTFCRCHFGDMPEA